MSQVSIPSTSPLRLHDEAAQLRQRQAQWEASIGGQLTQILQYPGERRGDRFRESCIYQTSTPAEGELAQEGFTAEDRNQKTALAEEDMISPDSMNGIRERRPRAREKRAYRDRPVHKPVARQ